jgi:hypothetical protein
MTEGVKESKDNLRKSQTIAKLRRVLLPKLLSGEKEVGEIEKLVGDEV